MVISSLTRSVLSFAGAMFLFAGTVHLQAQNYAWKNVNVSGAGAMVTGIIAHPGQSGLFYIRTDVGGSYRWDSANSKWIPLNDGLSFPLSDDYCCESLAIDPSNTNILYYAGGLGTYGRSGGIFRSTDQGATWIQQTGTSTGTFIYMDGNGDRRWAGERLAVSPVNPAVVLFGSRKDGLWRTANSGTTWAKVATVPTATDSYGVQAVAFDPTSGSRVYAAVSGTGVFKSTDSGATWTWFGGSTNPRRLKIAPNGNIWLTTGTGVSKYNGAWVNYAPAGAGVACNAVAINPANSNEVLVARETALNTSSIWRTTDAGATWTPLNYSVSSSATWALPTLHNFRPTDFVYDPFNSGTTSAIVWGDRWRTLNIAASGTVAWQEQEAGHEEDVTGAVAAPPSGTELFVGVFDDDGFRMNNGLDSYPTKQLGIAGSWNGHTWGIAYQETNPMNMIRLGTQTFYGGTQSGVSRSTDGGATWNRLTFPSNLFPIACAASATSGSNYVVICNANYTTDTSGGSWNVASATNPWRYTTNSGATWNVITGLPTPPAPTGPWGDNQILAADHVNGSKYFYLAVDPTTNTTSGKIYASTNSGASFTQVNVSSTFPAGKRFWSIKTKPGAEGDVWASVDNFPSSGRTSDEGLYHSADNGATWSKISAVNRAFSFGFGKPPTGTTPALYIYGRVNSGTTDSLYQSLDTGATWTNIQTTGSNLSDFPSFLEGSRQTAGRVFVGTGGRGIFYGSITTTTPYGGIAASIPGTVEAENFDLGGEGLAYHDTTVNNNGGQYRLTEGVDIETCTDTGGGYDISFTAAGEWMKYTVNVAAATTYVASFRVASANTGATFHLENASGTNLTGPIAVPNTGSWTTWTIVTKNVTLPAGQQVLKVVEDTGGFNFNYILFN